MRYFLIFLSVAFLFVLSGQQPQTFCEPGDMHYRPNPDFKCEVKGYTITSDKPFTDFDIGRDTGTTPEGAVNIAEFDDGV